MKSDWNNKKVNKQFENNFHYTYMYKLRHNTFWVSEAYQQLSLGILIQTVDNVYLSMIEFEDKTDFFYFISGKQ